MSSKVVIVEGLIGAGKSSLSKELGEAQWYAMNKQGHAVLDRSYFGDTSFARLQVKTGAMTSDEFETYRSIYHAMTASVLLPSVCVRLVVSPEVAAKRIQRRMELQTGRKCENVIDINYLRELDREITHMVNVLSEQGVQTIHVPWDADRGTREARVDSVKEIAAQIIESQPKDLFLDLHRRTL